MDIIITFGGLFYLCCTAFLWECWFLCELIHQLKWLSGWTIFQTKTPKISWCWRFKCEYLLVLIIICERKLNIFGFWSVNWTKKRISNSPTTIHYQYLSVKRGGTVRTLIWSSNVLQFFISSPSAGYYGSIRHATNAQRDIQLVHTDVCLFQTQRSHLEGIAPADN